MSQRVPHVRTSLSILKQGAASILVLLLMLGMSLAGDDHDVARWLRQSGSSVPMEQILKTLSAAHPARILEITLQKKQERFVYTVEYVDAHGVVWKRLYDAKSGTLLQTTKGN